MRHRLLNDHRSCPLTTDNTTLRMLGLSKPPPSINSSGLRLRPDSLSVSCTCHLYQVQGLMPLHKEFTRFKLPRGDLSEDKDPTFFICIPRAQCRHTAGIQYTAAKLTNVAHLTKMYQFQASSCTLAFKGSIENSRGQMCRKFPTLESEDVGSSPTSARNSLYCPGQLSQPLRVLFSFSINSR